MTTVGYGDLSPQTGGGKGLAAVVMLVGIGFVAILTGAVAERFLKPDVAEEEAATEAVGDAIPEEARGGRRASTSRPRIFARVASALPSARTGISRSDAGGSRGVDPEAGQMPFDRGPARWFRGAHSHRSRNPRT